MTIVRSLRVFRVRAAALAALGLCGLASSWAASPAAGEPVNPFSGQPRSLESTQRRLEQMRLETQLLEEEARQATLRGTIAAARAGAGERRGLPAALPAPAPGAAVATPAQGAAPRPTGPRRPQPPSPPVVTRPGAATGSAPGSMAGSIATASAVAGSPAAAPASSTPGNAQLLAILRDGERRRAVLQMGLSALTVQEGDEVQGLRVGAIGDSGLTLDGRMIELMRGSATVALSDRRPAPGLAPSAPGLARPQAPLPLAPPAGGAALGPRPQTTGAPWPVLPPLPRVDESAARSGEPVSSALAPAPARPRANGSLLPMAGQD